MTAIKRSALHTLRLCLATVTAVRRSSGLFGVEGELISGSFDSINCVGSAVGLCDWEMNVTYLLEGSHFQVVLHISHIKLSA